MAENKVAPVVEHYPYDGDKMHEIIERKDLSILNELGGIEGLAKQWETDLSKGIDPASYDKRKDQWGLNQLKKKDPVTFFPFLAEAFQDKIVILLCIAAIVSIIFGMTLPNPHTKKVERSIGWIEGVAITVTVAIVTLTGSIQNYNKAKRFEEMEAANEAKKIQVVRAGLEQSIDTKELVVGDIVVLESGIKFDCDGIFIDGTNLTSNEAAMTGESDLIKKNADKDPFFLSGTLLEDGAGHMLVIAIGMSTFQGRLKEDTEGDGGETPLQEHLSELADDIGKAGFLAAGVLIIGLCIKEGILIGEYGKEANFINFLNFIIIAVTLIVVAIPEGLPLAVTISLAYSMDAMMDDQCLVRVLASCETMGAATTVCSDKTGTLTTNVMTVVQGCVAEEEFVIDNYGVSERNENITKIARSTVQKGETLPLQTTADNIEKFCFAMSINSTAKQQEITGDDGKPKMEWTGNKTEHGLLGFVNYCGKSYVEARQSVTPDCKKQFPFNSAKKRMTTIVKDNAGLMTAYCKGASELILDDCDQYLDKDGAAVDMSPQKRQLFLDVILDMNRQGNRSIGIAYSPCHFTEFPEEEPSVSMVFMGVMGIQDPIRPEVPGAVVTCQKAGLIVRMVTGDNKDTAIAISKKANIFQDNGYDKAIEGKELRARADRAKENEQEKKELLEDLARIRIVARSSPSDKHVLVGLLQEMGEVVGVTGDGTNDAPALKLADVGFAMNDGTDIAKGASDMILLDNNFASVVNATKWGRAVNDNVRKFLQFQLSINVGGVLLTIIGSLASETSKEPFTPVQLLWLNLIMDTMAAIALATEKPDETSLLRKPIYKQAPLIGNKMRAFIGIHSAFQAIVILVILLTGHLWFQTVETNRDYPKSDAREGFAKAGLSIHEPSNLKCDRNWIEWPECQAEAAVLNSYPNNFSVSEFYENWEEEYYQKDRCYFQIHCDLECTSHGGVMKDDNICLQGLVHSTIIFNTYIWMQIFNIFNARKLFGEMNPFEGVVERSQPLLKVFGIILACQVIAVEVLGPFAKFMETTHLTWYYWLICVGWGLLEIPIGFIPRLLPIKDFVPPEVIEKEEKEKRTREECLKKWKAENPGH